MLLLIPYWGYLLNKLVAHIKISNLGRKEGRKIGREKERKGKRERMKEGRKKGLDGEKEKEKTKGGNERKKERVEGRKGVRKYMLIETTEYPFPCTNLAKMFSSNQRGCC